MKWTAACKRCDHSATQTRDPWSNGPTRTNRHARPIARTHCQCPPGNAKMVTPKSQKGPVELAIGALYATIRNFDGQPVALSTVETEMTMALPPSRSRNVYKPQRIGGRVASSPHRQRSSNICNSLILHSSQQLPISAQNGSLQRRRFRPHPFS